MKSRPNVYLRPRPSECPHCGRSGDSLEPTNDGGWRCTVCNKVVGNN